MVRARTARNARSGDRIGASMGPPAGGKHPIQPPGEIGYSLMLTTVSVAGSERPAVRSPCCLGPIDRSNKAPAGNRGSLHATEVSSVAQSKILADVETHSGPLGLA